MPRIVNLEVRDTPRGVPEETRLTLQVADPSSDPDDIALSNKCVHSILFDENNIAYTEVSGTPEQLAAYAAVNPLSAALFAVADKKWLDVDIGGGKVRKIWEWVGKIGGSAPHKILSPEGDTLDVGQNGNGQPFKVR